MKKYIYIKNTESKTFLLLKKSGRQNFVYKRYQNILNVIDICCIVCIYASFICGNKDLSEILIDEL
jgi:hypothetical protein